MSENRISKKQEHGTAKERLVRKKGWFVPSIHGKYLEAVDERRDSDEKEE